MGLAGRCLAGVRILGIAGLLVGLLSSGVHAGTNFLCCICSNCTGTAPPNCVVPTLLGLCEDYCFGHGCTNSNVVPGPFRCGLPCVAPTATGTATSTATPTATPVPEGGACMETAQCERPLSCIDEVCTRIPAPAPALTPVLLIVALGLLAAIAAVGVWRRR